MGTSLPDQIAEAFSRGEHVCRHKEGVLNSVFLDQFGEQTYIRYGMAKCGLVGETFVPKANCNMDAIISLV